MDRVRIPDLELRCPACGEYRLVEIWGDEATCAVCSRSWAPARVAAGTDHLTTPRSESAARPATDVSGHPIERGE